MALRRNKTKKFNKKPTRKEIRKEKRKEKKVKRNEFYTKQNKTGEHDTERTSTLPAKKKMHKEQKEQKLKGVNNQSSNSNEVLTTEQIRSKEQKERNKLQKEMDKQRIKQMLDANEEEDLNIKHLEKQLKLNKRKSKSIPKSFAEDGLDYLLEVCDSEAMSSTVTTEQQWNETNNEFEEDLTLMTEGTKLKDGTDKKNKAKKRPNSSTEDTRKIKKAKLIDTELDSFDEDDSHSQIDSEDDIEAESETKGAIKMNEDGTWEDIYGRLRAKDGSVINKSEKYVPPSIRAKLESDTTEDKTIIENLSRLKKQLKGLLNRLAERNMHNIASQIENLYMNNSRNDMNETLTSLITESLVSEVIAPERLLIEHVVLMIVLHANVGTEVGAHFLQSAAKKFDEYLHSNHDVENKMLDNIVNIISQLYNFKLFDAKLMYDILNKLSFKFEEKEVECILHILKSVGFTLRKEDPLALKNFILDIQKRASTASEDVKDNPRVKFMFEILLSIKNNNITKFKNDDNLYSEHLKKVMKSIIRKGNYVTQFNISLEDLLKADERGRWWVVGSAWSGNAPLSTEKAKKSANTEVYSEKLLALAKKQRMNTDTRRNIFCILMSAEDYLDAFEKLLQLNLRNQQEREIIHVILHCCLQEKQYNQYYAVLAQKFCDYDRKYQMTIKCSIWDKLKSLDEHSSNQLSHLAKMLTHLFLERGLPISTLKIVEFSELDKVTLRFMRQILLGILLTKDTEACISVFQKVAQADKLKLFRESLRLFIHHFLLRNLNSEGIPDDQKALLETRVDMIEKIMRSS